VVPVRDGSFEVVIGPGPYSVMARLCHEGRDASTTTEIVGKDVGRVVDL
jgi:hypothetical protein